MNACLPCAVCSKTLERVDEKFPNQPYEANIFVSYGHYGATAYDSPGGERLEMFICTECMEGIKKRNAIHRVLEGTKATPSQRFVWGSDEDSVGDNPKNELRLNNEFAMDRYCESTFGMTEEWAHKIYEACMIASKNGEEFNPSDIPSP